MDTSEQTPPETRLVDVETSGTALPDTQCWERSLARTFGDYELIGELGRGGMGVVYRARHVRLNRLVALKMLKADVLATEDDLRRFQNEAEAVAQLDHPNIVPILEIGEIDGCRYFTMRLIDGDNLATRLKDSALPARSAARHVAHIARAIQHAHEHKILHRDLKPSNILLDANDCPFVADFGLAKTLEGDRGQTRTGAIVGTPSYMAPEQASGSKILSPATDVYGLGAILYELLAQRPPFQGAPLDVLSQVLERDPVPPSLFNPDLPWELETICLKCLDKDPLRRYASAHEVAADLERYLASEPIVARAVNLAERLKSALWHSQYDVEYRAYGTLCLILAAVILLVEVGVNALIWIEGRALYFRILHSIEFLVLGTVLWRSRTHLPRPVSTAERLMTSVWLGYIGSLLAIALNFRIVFGWTVEADLALYPIIAGITGMPFLILGSCYWGWSYVFGAAFYLLPLLMTWTPRWAPLEFGLVWAVALITIGIRLRRMPAQES